MRHGVERYDGLHPRHDGERKRRKLRRQFLDAEPKSGDQQRRTWQRPTLDRDWRLLELLVRASCSDGIGGIWDDAIQH
jgi:hypothetical protein